MNKHEITLIGVGEMGGVFARGFLKSGYTVKPVTRQQSIPDELAETDTSTPILIAVAEKDLHPVLDQIPESHMKNLILLQNELLPGDWEQHDIHSPTVISVWFEKKKGREAKVIVPSPVYGKYAHMIKDSMSKIDIPVRTLNSEHELLYELVLKNLYIITTNVSGLKVGGNVGELWAEHEILTRNVSNDVLDIQEWLTGEKFDREKLIMDMLRCFEGDPSHQCMGRSAPARLQRALEQAEKAGLEVSQLKQIAEMQNNPDSY
jgi:ketopantoate reductase